ncbi:MAG TPA: ferric reductase-like transmembrane domain-containing protein [archaeon]|nr:ferric reductase-like transmembrane domain-containing protein [archaeon]
MRVHEFRSYINSFMVFAFFLAFNLLTNDLGLLKNVSKAAAVAGTILIAITLLLGPLSRFFPGHFRHDLIYRKPLGIAGFFFAAVHVVVAFFNSYNADIYYIFSESNPNFLPAVYGTVAFLILIALALTSTASAIKNMGFRKWKMLQRTGYIALALIMLHFATLGGGYFLKTNTGKTLLALGIIAIAAKILVLLLDIPKKHSKEEIKHLTKE